MEIAPVTICYHTTSSVAAESILNGAFRDSREDHPLFGEMNGVYLCEDPLNGGGLPDGTPVEKYAQVLIVEFKHDFDLEPFVLDPTYPRVWHLPADEITRNAKVTLLGDGDADGGKPS